MKRAFAACVFVLQALVAAPLLAQGTAPDAAASPQIDGTWLGRIQDDPRPRSMNILAVQPREQGLFTVDATYGYADGGQSAVRGEFDPAQRRLVFVTPAKSKVELLQSGEDAFDGTFTSSKGEVKKMALTRASGAQLEAAVFDPPAADVPPACAAFHGGWDGRWSTGSLGPQKLWITGVRADCRIRYSYRSTDDARPPKALRSGEIKDGVLTVPCGDEGKCSFERRGDEIHGIYRNPYGGVNNAVFRRIR